MISKETREFIVNRNEKGTFLNLSGSLLTDEALIELTELVSHNPYITCIDLDRVRLITKTAVIQFMENLPGVNVINADCFKPVQQLMDEATQTVFKQGYTLPLSFYNSLNSKKDITTEIENTTHSNTEQEDVVFKI